MSLFSVELSIISFKFFFGFSFKKLLCRFGGKQVKMNHGPWQWRGRSLGFGGSPVCSGDS